MKSDSLYTNTSRTRQHPRVQISLKPSPSSHSHSDHTFIWTDITIKGGKRKAVWSLSEFQFKSLRLDVSVSVKRGSCTLLKRNSTAKLCLWNDLHEHKGLHWLYKSVITSLPEQISWSAVGSMSSWAFEIIYKNNVKMSCLFIPEVRSPSPPLRTSNHP